MNPVDKWIRDEILRTQFRVTFGKACCDDCAQGAPPCGGSKFGASAAAPPPPAVGWPFSTNDVIAYGKYINDRVNDFAATYQKWMNYLDPSEATCPNIVQMIAQGMSQEAIFQACHPKSYAVRQSALAWSTQVSWLTWQQNWNDYAPYVMTDSTKLTLETQACGGVCGEYPVETQYHKQLQWMASVATQMGLPDVPDAGALAVVPSAGQKLGEVVNTNVSDLASQLVAPALIIGGIYLGVSLLKGRK